MNGILGQIQKYSARPALFEPGEARFWDDPHISKSMLEAHLNPDNDAASRRPETIEKEVRHLISAGVLKREDRLLDLGCGPGLYASRLAMYGLYVTGIDISERSLNYAIAQAASNGLNIDYRCGDFFDIDYSGEFDTVMQVYGELNAFSDEKRDKLLLKINRSLRPGGLFIFDVSTREQFKRNVEKSGLKNRWEISEGGFWRTGRHLVLEQDFDYPEHDVCLSQTIIIDENQKESIYRLWYHDYNLETITPALEKAGFEIANAWNDLTGTPYKEGGDWIAIVARKS